eukprot:6570360-Heterocapsa_arctica.AAC.1
MAMEALKQPNTLLWAAMPCTGGSSWQNINRCKDGGEEKFAVTRHKFQLNVLSFVKVATVCHKHGGNISIERPPGCAYWLWESTIAFIATYKLNPVKLNGCTVGLADENVAQ